MVSKEFTNRTSEPILQAAFCAWQAVESIRVLVFGRDGNTVTYLSDISQVLVKG